MMPSLLRVFGPGRVRVKGNLDLCVDHGVQTTP